MEPKFGSYFVEQHSHSIVCRKCGKTGRIVWDDISRPDNSAPEPVGIDGPFFERLSKKPPYPIELVCRACGGVGATVLPSASPHGNIAPAAVHAPPPSSLDKLGMRGSG